MTNVGATWSRHVILGCPNDCTQDHPLGMKGLVDLADESSQLAQGCYIKLLYLAEIRTWDLLILWLLHVTVIIRKMVLACTAIHEERAYFPVNIDFQYLSSAPLIQNFILTFVRYIN